MYLVDQQPTTTMLNEVYSEIYVLGFKQPVTRVKRPVLIRIKQQTWTT